MNILIKNIKEDLTNSNKDNILNKDKIDKNLNILISKMENIDNNFKNINDRINNITSNIGISNSNLIKEQQEIFQKF